MRAEQARIGVAGSHQCGRPNRNNTRDGRKQMAWEGLAVGMGQHAEGQMAEEGAVLVEKLADAAGREATAGVDKIRNKIRAIKLAEQTGGKIASVQFLDGIERWVVFK